jgi:hypothetical protein
VGAQKGDHRLAHPAEPNEMSNCNRLLDLYVTVVGRQPVGKPVTPDEKAAHEQRLASSLPVPPSPHRPMRIPDLIIEFCQLFGGEEALTQTYYTIFGPEHISTGYGHLIFAADPRSGLDFGISHFVLPFENPDVVVAPAKNRNDVFGWSDYSESLDDCLVEFACRNLCNSMRYILHVDNADVPRVQTELAGYPSIALTQSGESGPHHQPYYAPGTIISHQLRDHTLTIGLDTLQRALAFQAKHDWSYAEVFVEP